MKKIISLALLGATTSLMALYAEHASLYKDPRVMGMGGASVAVGAYSSSVFSNPAGLANIKKDHGLVVDLLNIGVNGSADIQAFSDDLDAVPENDMTAMTEVLEKYNGTNFHIGVDNYTSISKNSDAFAWSLGFLAANDTNIMTHANGGSESLLGVSQRVYGGVVLGFAKPYETEFGRLDVGLSAKYITQNSYEGGLTVSELLADDPSATIEDRLVDSTGIGVDIGVTYHPLVDNYWHPAIGFSVMNIGSIDMGGVYGGQPTTLNLGMSITPELPVFNKFIFAVDYVDLLGANKLRMYNGTNADNSFAYTDYDENDMMKRLRVGLGMGLVDTRFFSLALNAGWYQNAYTAGVNMELLIFKLNASTYQENIGTTATPIEDRRYMAQIGIGW